MAHYSVHVGTVQRSKGENAIASAAYISRSKLNFFTKDKETGIISDHVWDYSKKGGLGFSKIYAADDSPEWVFDRERLWNKAELAENRVDGVPAGKIMLALPKELSEEQNIALLEDIVSELVSLGMIVDANIHNDKEENPHAHLQHTLREVELDKYNELNLSRLKRRDWMGPGWVKMTREMIADKINKHYKLNGFDLTVTHKSYKELGVDLEPGRHEGPARNIKNAELAELNREIAKSNAEKIKECPTIILDVIGLNRPVFTKEHIAVELEKRLHAGINFDKIDDIESLQNELSGTFTSLYSQILASPELSLVIESDLKGRTLYTTTKRVELEERYTNTVQELHQRNNHSLGLTDSDLDHLSVSEKLGEKTKDIAGKLVDHINQTAESFGAKGALLDKPKQNVALSKEQRKAVLNILNGGDISVLEGLPGAGKTTAMREIVRQYRKQGRKVIGVAPSSSASLELAKATGIECMNGSQWRKEWQKQQNKEFELVLRGDYYKEDRYKDNDPCLTNKHVVIIDESSMGELANMDYLLSEAKRAGSKVLLVGDNNQLSAVGWAGAFAKAINVCGSERLEESRRQRNPEHRKATKLLAEYKVRKALDIYWKEGAIIVAENESEANNIAVRNFVDNYIEDARIKERDDLASTRTKAIGVFSNKTRDMLNEQVRESLKEAGILKGKEYRLLVGQAKRDGEYKNHYLSLQRGEQIVISRNQNYLGENGTFNGELGTVLKIHGASDDPSTGDSLGRVDILVHKASGQKERVKLDLRELAKEKYFNEAIAIDYGYAVTSHKVQGASIDDNKVRIEKGVGYNVFNVLATRHKNSVQFIVDKQTLENSFYESLDKDSKEARNRFELGGQNEETILRGGLAKLISKRTDTSFASDYRTLGITGDDQLLKNYIDVSNDTISVIRQISNWQHKQLRLTGAKPNLWEHEQWQEFKDLRFKRAAFARIITNNYPNFKQSIIQSNLNYATLEKHASQLHKRTQLDKIEIETKITKLHETDAYKELVMAVAGRGKAVTKKLLHGMQTSIAETHAEIDKLLEEKVCLIEKEEYLRSEIEIQEDYGDKLLPEYLDRIYRCSGKEALSTYDQLVIGHGKEKAALMVDKRPTLLGELKGVGIGKLIRFGGTGKDVTALLVNLTKQLKAYNRSTEMLEEARDKLKSGEFQKEIKLLDQDLEKHRALLPSELDKEFFARIEEELKIEGRGDKKFKALLKSEVFEAVKEAVLIAGVEQRNDKIELEAAVESSVPSQNVTDSNSWISSDLTMTESEIQANPSIFIESLNGKAFFNRSDIEYSLKRVTGEESVSSELVDTVLLDTALKIVSPMGMDGKMLFARKSQITLENDFLKNLESINSRNNHSLKIGDKDIAEFSEGKEFSESQKQVIKKICSGNDLSMLEGWPGSGKSTVTKEIVRQYQENGYEIIALAPTNKAAQELQSKLGTKVITTTRFLIGLEKAEDHNIALGDIDSKYSSDVQEILRLSNSEIQNEKSLVVLDEASMINGREFVALSQKASKNGWKILALGDNNQNHAVELPGFFAKLCSVAQRNMLEEVNRHKNPDLAIRTSHIKATEALCNFKVPEAINIYNSNGSIVVAESEAEKEMNVAHSYVRKVMEVSEADGASLHEAMGRVIMNAHTNDEVERLNLMARSSLKKAGALSGGKHYFAGGGNMLEVSIGDRILFKSNSKELGVVNNEFATIIECGAVDSKGIGSFRAIVHGSNGDKEVEIQTGKIRFLYGMAVTNYAVQGATIDYCLASIDKNTSYESLLVALTRHRLGCQIYAAKDTLESMIYLTKGLDVDRIKREYKAIGYSYVFFKNEQGKEEKVRLDLPLWQLGFSLLASRRANLNQISDVAHGEIPPSLLSKLNKVQLKADKSRMKLDNAQGEKLEHLQDQLKQQAAEANEIRQEIQVKSKELITKYDGNRALIKNYADARNAVFEARKKCNEVKKMLKSAKVQEELVAAIKKQYGLKLKYLTVDIRSIEKAQNSFERLKVQEDAVILEHNPRQKLQDIDKHRSSYLKQIVKNSEFKNIIKHSSLLVLDVLEESKKADGSKVLSSLGKEIEESKQILEAAKATQKTYAAEIVENYSGHVGVDRSQPTISNLIEQTSFNYHTICKHAETVHEKHYFKKNYKRSIASNEDYSRLIECVYKARGNELKSSDVETVIAAHKELSEQVMGVEEQLEGCIDKVAELRGEKAANGMRLQSLRHYVDVEFPHMLSITYVEGHEVLIERLDEMLEESTDHNQLVCALKDNPELVGSKLDTASRSSEELHKNIVEYIEAKDQMKHIESSEQGKDYATAMSDLEKQLKDLYSKLPTNSETEFLTKIGKVIPETQGEAELKQVGQDLKELFRQDESLDLIFQQHRIKKLDSIKQLSSQETGKADSNKKISSRNQRRQYTERLQFDDVARRLTSNDYEAIFRQYISGINSDDKVVKRGRNISCGSLGMDLKSGLWKRFSTGDSGNIFGFVEESTNTSKVEALEIVAEFVGITPKTVVIDNRHSQANTTNKNFKKPTQEKNQKTDEWIATKKIPKDAPEFKAVRDLSFLKDKGSKVAGVYNYRNKDGQILGHTVRVVDGEGQKQVLPAAYCYNEAKSKSRWQLKGFTDKGNKPIYGLEKLYDSEHITKPVLIVEGEKTADSASKLLPEYNVISWMGGAHGISRVDWSHLKEKEIIIWPDNDKPGIEAASKIGVRIDRHNGFTGMVRIVDTDSLSLPEKWDLADELPEPLKDQDIRQLLQDHGKTQSDATKLREYGNSGLLESNRQTLASLDVLMEKGRLDVPEGGCAFKAIYKESLAAIATSSDKDLSKDKGFVDAIRELQRQYTGIVAAYDRENQEQDKGSKEEQLAHELTRHTNVLHEIKLGVGSLSKAHREHISDTAKSIVASMKQFKDADQEYAGVQMLTAVSGEKWLGTLDAKNQDKTLAVKEELTACRAECLSIRDTLSAFAEETKKSNSPEEIFKIISKKQQYLVALGSELKYPDSHSEKIRTGISNAKIDKESKALNKLEIALASNLKQGIKSDIELAAILRKPKQNLGELANYLDKQSENERSNRLAGVSYRIEALEKLGVKVDKDQIVCEIKSMMPEARNKHLDAKIAKAARNYTNPTIKQHQLEKSQASNLSELMDAMKSEQKSLHGLHKEHKLAVYTMEQDQPKHTRELSFAITEANEFDRLGGMRELSKLIEHAEQHGIKTSEELFTEHKENSTSAALVYHGLQKTCQVYHKNMIDHHIDSFTKQCIDIQVGEHKFKDPISYLKHMKTEHDHRHLPIKYIDNQIKHFEQQRQLQSNLEKEQELQKHHEMSGPSV